MKIRYVLQMGIKFWKFVEKVPGNFSVMGFGAPENAKNRLFHVFGPVRQLRNAV